MAEVDDGERGEAEVPRRFRLHAGQLRVDLQGLREDLSTPLRGRPLPGERSLDPNRRRDDGHHLPRGVHAQAVAGRAGRPAADAARLLRPRRARDALPGL